MNVWENEREHEATGEDDGGRRVYFPLPSNEEQSRIVRFVSGSAGNLTNKVTMYNFLSTFSGTHYVTPLS
jgi:hypothetical protein